MNLDISTEHAELQQTLRQQFAQKSPPALARRIRVDDGGDDMAALWKSLADGGIIELGLPEEHGGGGGGIVELGIVMREAGRVVAPNAVKAAILFGLAVDRAGRGAFRDRWLRAVSGRHLRGAVLGAASLPLTAVAAASGGCRISGVVPFTLVPVGTEALFGTASTADGATSVAFVVDPRAAGVSVERHVMMGTQDIATVTLDVEVGEDDSSAEPVAAAAAGLARFADAWWALEAAEAVGGAEAVIERTVEYASNRIQFDRPIGSFQAAQHHVANVAIAVEGARIASLQALWLVGNDHPSGTAVAMARAVAVTAYKQATLRGHQLHGGLGMTLESDLHLWSERAKLLELSGELWDQFIERVADSLNPSSERPSA
jgi:alkylation response protein AidB-like acyl-CoA dehydrogenase